MMNGQQLAIAIANTRANISAYRPDVLQRLVAQGARASLETHTDAVAQAAHDLTRRGHRCVSELARLDDLIAVAGDCCSPGPNTDPRCTRDGRRICDYDRIGDRDDVTGGDQPFSLSPEPQAGFSWWNPALFRMYAHDQSNPSITRWEGLFITLITIGSHPVEGFNAQPAAGVNQGIAVNDYVVPDNSGVPVGWPVFSNSANSNQLEIAGIGLWPAAVNYRVFCSVMGNPRKSPGGPDFRCAPGAVGTQNGGNMVGPSTGVATALPSSRALGSM